MSDISLYAISSGYSLSSFNYNFQLIENVINTQILHLTGGNNVMLQDLDMNGNQILNLATDPNNPASMLTVADGDTRYINTTGDAMAGQLSMSGNTLTGLKAPVDPTDAVRKLEFDVEVGARSSADANLQGQISGGIPLEASAFSPISWHDQTVDNSVTIPANKNAWSFGPTMTISVGQTVTIGSGSFWTVANGEVQP